jgi:hypothetical protein
MGLHFTLGPYTGLEEAETTAWKPKWELKDPWAQTVSRTVAVLDTNAIKP